MQVSEVRIPTKPERFFLSADVNLAIWDSIKPYFNNLLEREIEDVSQLKQWLKDSSELEAALSEYFANLYIRKTCNTNDKPIADAYEDFIANVKPNIFSQENELNKKLTASPYFSELKENQYFPFLRNIKHQLKIYRQENVAIQVKEEVKKQSYLSSVGNIIINIKGQELTPQQAEKFLKNADVNIRKEAFNRIWQKRLELAFEFDTLYSELIHFRDTIAKNADFKNYRDYAFVKLGRFDYTVEDCFNFHSSIQELVVPILEQLAYDRKAKLQVSHLKPWDLEVDPSSNNALRPFDKKDDFLNKTIECLNLIDPYFGECLFIMKEKNLVDLFSRPGKAPGGYNYPLSETGIPFIFMNAVGSDQDIKVLTHEAGHAIHSFLYNDLELNAFKDITSEVAELASMSMELFSMEHWNIFYTNPEDLKRAKKKQLQSVLNTLAWVATIDSFQHWIYTHPNHSIDERDQNWLNIFDRFSSKTIDWTGVENVKAKLWQKQLHLFTSPFYYIEYAIAQLGAIAMWKQFKENKQQAIENYKSALRLGYTKTIPEIYKTAGIEFSFSKEYITELVTFVNNELKALE